MTIFLLTFIIMAVAVLAMAIGVFLGRHPIRGSCGGLNQIDGLECACSTPCERKKQAMQRAGRPPQAGPFNHP